MTIEDLALTTLQEGRPAYINRDQGIKDPIPVGALLVEIERTLGIPVSQLDVRHIGHFGFYVEVRSDKT